MSSNPLTVVREKLLATDVPLSLRVSYYLRVSCANLASDDIRYSTLLKALYTENVRWMETCSVSMLGTLESSDRTISALLSPITALHQADLFPEMPVPVAA